MMKRQWQNILKCMVDDELIIKENYEEIFIREEIERLPKIEKSVVEKIFYEDKTLNETAKELKINPIRVLRIKIKPSKR